MSLKKKIINILAIIPFVLFICLLIINIILFSPVARTESIWMDSPLGEKVYGNLYYPKNPHPSRSVIIVFHGLGQESTLDLRPALELTKRGFYVLSVDQSGHGLTYGIQPGLEDDVLKPFFFQNVIGVVDWIFSRPDLFNTSAIGCMGQSLGGWTTLMATVIEPRISAYVSWAGVANVSALELERTTLFKNIGVTPENDFFEVPGYQVNHSVVEYWNGTYGVNPPSNLLLIHGTLDDIVPVNQSIDAYNLVNDSSKCNLVLIEGGDHALISNKPVNETIWWFETKLLGGLQGPLDNSQFTYITFYISYLLLLLGLYTTVFGVSFWIFKAKDQYLKPINQQEIEEGENKKTYGKAILKLILYSMPVLGIWLLLYFLQSIIYNYLIMLLFGAGFLALYEVLFFFFQARKSLSKDGIKTAIKNQFNTYNMLIAILIAIYYVAVYFAIASGFKFLLLSPRSLSLYFISLVAIFPFLLTNEIFQRKLVQDQFPRKRNLHKGINSLILLIFTFVSFYPLFYLITGAFFSVLVIVVFMISVTTVNIYLYEKTQSVLATSLMSSIVCAFFIAHIYFFFI